MLTQLQVFDLFDYKDGVLFWKTTPSRKIPIGSKAGTITAKGYIRIKINGRLYYAHRLVYLLETGTYPKQLDHVNGDKSDNRIKNLRECDVSQNNLNRKKPRNNSSGIKGISWHAISKKWMVSLQIAGEQKYFGLYKDIDQAKSVIEAMRHKYHGDFTNHG
jgi:hypothetical protein